MAFVLIRFTANLGEGHDWDFKVTGKLFQGLGDSADLKGTAVVFALDINDVDVVDEDHRKIWVVGFEFVGLGNDIS